MMDPIVDCLILFPGTSYRERHEISTISMIKLKSAFGMHEEHIVKVGGLSVRSYSILKGTITCVPFLFPKIYKLYRTVPSLPYVGSSCFQKFCNNAANNGVTSLGQGVGPLGTSSPGKNIVIGGKMEVLISEHVLERNISRNWEHLHLLNPLIPLSSF